MNAATATTIEVAKAEPPKAGKKQGTIRTTSGEVLGVWPDKLGLLRPGNSYLVEFSEREWNGRTFKTITKVQPQAANANNSKAASGDDREFEFVARVLSASIQACAVTYTREGLTDAVRMLRNVYRDGMK